MLKRPIILVDMDDTVCETSKKWNEMLFNSYGHDPVDTSIYDKVKQYPMLTEDEVMGPIREPGFFSSLMPKENAIHYMLMWLRDGYDVRFASVVYPDCQQAYSDKMEWIQEHIPEMAKRTIIFSSHDKTLLYGTIIIDDHPTHIEDACWPIPICLAAPWNKHLEEERLYAYTWLDVDQHVRKILKWKGME